MNTMHNRPPHRLLLASTSVSRRELLANAGIPFSLLPIDVDEKQCDWGLPLVQLVCAIAAHKMDHAVIPAEYEGDAAFVLTADTLSQDAQGNVTGKPIDRDDAAAMIRAARGGMTTSTAFCLEKRIATATGWQTQQRIMQHVTAQYVFEIPEEWLEWYLSTSRGLSCSGAIAIEDHGGLFLRSVHGSYTTIVGLPLYELRVALAQIGFFS